MKFVWSFLLCSALAVAGVAQSPVRWEFSSRKLGPQLYEVTLVADVQPPWHIYSQHMEEGGPVPTKISFKSNPLVLLQGAVQESGRLVTKREEVFEMDVKYFEGKAVFTQKLKLKTPVKTQLTGTVDYMVCNEEQCLPPATVPFTIYLKN